MTRSDPLHAHLASAPASLGAEGGANEMTLRFRIHALAARTPRTQAFGIAAIVLSISLWMAFLVACLVQFDGDGAATLLPFVVALVGAAAVTVATWPRRVHVRLTPERVTIGRWSAPLTAVVSAAVERRGVKEPHDHVLVVRSDVPYEWSATREEEAGWLARAITLLAARARKRPAGRVPEGLHDLAARAAADDG